MTIGPYLHSKPIFEKFFRSIFFRIENFIFKYRIIEPLIRKSYLKSAKVIEMSEVKQLEEKGSPGLPVFPEFDESLYSVFESLRNIIPVPPHPGFETLRNFSQKSLLKLTPLYRKINEYEYRQIGNDFSLPRKITLAKANEERYVSKAEFANGGTKATIRFYGKERNAEITIEDETDSKIEYWKDYEVWREYSSGDKNIELRTSDHAYTPSNKNNLSEIHLTSNRDNELSQVTFRDFRSHVPKFLEIGSAWNSFDQLEAKLSEIINGRWTQTGWLVWNNQGILLTRSIKKFKNDELYFDKYEIFRDNRLVIKQFVKKRILPDGTPYSISYNSGWNANISIGDISFTAAHGHLEKFNYPDYEAECVDGKLIGRNPNENPGNAFEHKFEITEAEILECCNDPKKLVELGRNIRYIPGSNCGQYIAGIFCPPNSSQ